MSSPVLTASDAPATARRTLPRPRAQSPPWNFAEWFILSQTFIPALLYLPGSQAFRVPIRLASYGISLAVLAAVWMFMRPGVRRSIRPHPAAPWLFASLAYLGLMLLHPETNSYLAGAAQIGLYFTILAPVFWASALVRSPAHLRRLLWVLLFCNGVNAFVGVMQAHNPDVWMPREFSSILTKGEFGLSGLAYQGANGQTVIRPPGLSDAPGGVCGPAVFALYFGLVTAVVDPAWWRKALATVFATLGAAAIFLTLVRSSFLIAVGMVAVYILLQLGQGKPGRAGALLALGLAAVTAAFLHSSELGGDSITDRFHSIVEEKPADFYNENRGNQVASGFTTLLPKYPLGAGLGRWGMMNVYFGDQHNRNSTPIWVEIQFPAWIVDGGVILLILYPTALWLALRRQAGLTFHHPDPRVRSLAGTVLAANAGLVALCFSYPVFLAPVGMQFWFLSGALEGIAGGGKPRAARRPAPPIEMTAALPGPQTG